MPRPPAHCERLAEQELHEAVGRVVQAAHRREREVAAGGRGHEVDEADEPPLGVVAEREHGIAVVGRVHVVERHREAALGLAAQPRAADALDLAALLERQLARPHEARAVPGLAAGA